jgi:Uma2 family endonuclease
MTVDTRPFTADELLRLPDDGDRYELVRGELRKMSPAGSRHGVIAAELIASLGPFVRKHALGRVFTSETGFLIGRNPDTVRAPDCAFVTNERFVDTAGFFPGPPDLAVEVMSPGDSSTEVGEKTLEWLRAGARVVIVVDPRTRTVAVHRSSGATIATEAIEVEDVVPGWRLPLADLFA